MSSASGPCFHRCGQYRRKRPHTRIDIDTGSLRMSVGTGILGRRPDRSLSTSRRQSWKKTSIRLNCYDLALRNFLMNAFGGNIGIVFLIVATLVPVADRTFAGALSAGIGIVDVQRVLRDSKASKSIRPTIDNIRKEFRNRSVSRNKALPAEQGLADSERYAPEAFAQKRRIFSERARRAKRSRKGAATSIGRLMRQRTNSQKPDRCGQKATEKLNILIEKRFVHFGKEAGCDRRNHKTLGQASSHGCDRFQQSWKGRSQGPEIAMAPDPRFSPRGPFTLENCHRFPVLP